MKNRHSMQKVMKCVFIMIIIVHKLPHQSTKKRLINPQTFEKGLRIKTASCVKEEVIHRKLKKIEIPVSFDSIKFF